MKLRHTLISIPSDGVWIDGGLAHAPDVRGLAIVLQPGHGGAFQRREEQIATVLQAEGFATLSLELLTRHEALRDPDMRFNVARLTDRILAVSDWIDHQPFLSGLALGLLALDTASAAAIRAAVRSPEHFSAIVSLGGRPDLAGAGPLRALRTPTMFVVGRNDPGTAILRQAFEMIPGQHQWQAADGAEPEHADHRELEASTAFAAAWFMHRLPLPQASAADDSAAVAPPAADDATSRD